MRLIVRMMTCCQRQVRMFVKGCACREQLALSPCVFSPRHTLGSAPAVVQCARNLPFSDILAQHLLSVRMFHLIAEYFLRFACALALLTAYS